MQCVKREPRRTKSQELLHYAQSKKEARINVNLLGKIDEIVFTETPRP